MSESPAIVRSLARRVQYCGGRKCRRACVRLGRLHISELFAAGLTLRILRDAEVLYESGASLDNEPCDS